jgi:hypothetical protein
MSETIVNYIDSANFHFALPPNNITFNAEGGEVGRLEWTKEGITFTGKADESAKIFFNDFLKMYFDNYIKELIKEDLK